MHLNHKHDRIRLNMVAFNHSKKTTKGFTIIELVIVIVIIGILAVISFVVYNGITNRAKRVAMEAEADKLTKKLAIYRADNDTYPKSLKTKECNDSDESELCFNSDYFIDYGIFDHGNDDPTDDGYWFEIWPTDEDGEFCKEEHCGGGIIGWDDGDGDDDGGGNDGGGDAVPGLPEHCPEGFIPVPGSAFYKQPGFCVMKYEASNLNGKAVSRYDLPSWGSVTNNQAREYAQTACSGCKLMTLSQWMTLARDIVQVDKNWINIEGGGGQAFAKNNFLPTGFSNYNYISNGGQPPLLASSDDEDGYFGVNSGDEMAFKFQRRTLFLSNGEVIWDLAGHFAEQVDYIIPWSTVKPYCLNSNNKPTVCEWDDAEPSEKIGSFPYSPLNLDIFKDRTELEENALGFVVGLKDDNMSRGLVMGADVWNGGGNIFSSFTSIDPDSLDIDEKYGYSLFLSDIVWSVVLDGVVPLGFRATLE